MSRIYYLGYYDTIENIEENRSCYLAATNKMSYIISAIEASGHCVEVVSPSVTRNNRFYKGKTIPIQNQSQVRLFATFPNSPRILRIIGRCITKLQMLIYLLRKLKKGDTVIAYHSLSLIRSIRFLKKIRRIRLILEVEEFYGDVMGKSKVSQREQEFFQMADGYLFPAERLNQKVNVRKKPYTLICGTYQQEESRNCSFEKPEWQGKIHCVYAGTLDPRKGGAELAMRAAEHLPENYHIHILGFGTEQEIQNTKNRVKDLAEICKCGISYDGCLKGEEFIRFLQCCQIGLSTHDSTGAFNDTSFPSKILTYMANGLQVVTIRIPVVEESPVGRWVYFYDEPLPEKIAKTIIKAYETDAEDRRNFISELDQDFVNTLRKMVEA